MRRAAIISVVGIVMASLLSGATPASLTAVLEFHDMSAELAAGRLPSDHAPDSEDDSDTIWIRCVVEPCEPKATGCSALFVHVYRTKKSSNVERTVLKGFVDIYLIHKSQGRVVQAMTAPLISMVPRGCCQKRGYGQRIKLNSGKCEVVVVFHRVGLASISASAPLE